MPEYTLQTLSGDLITFDSDDIISIRIINIRGTVGVSVQWKSYYRDMFSLIHYPFLFLLIS